MTDTSDAQQVAYALIAAVVRWDYSAIDAILGDCQDLPRVAAELAFLAAGTPGDHSPLPPAVGLRQAVAQGLIPVGLAAARTARHREGGFPPVVRRRGLESLYDPQALADWFASRSAP